jgi:hypothetical protein
MKENVITSKVTGAIVWGTDNDEINSDDSDSNREAYH